MAVYNTWALDIVYELRRSGKIRELAHLGFIDRGRGAVSVDIGSDRKYGTVYLSREAWMYVGLKEPQRLFCLNAIDTYEPLSQAVVTAISPLWQEFEVTTCLIKLN